jgi:hypothetical protein
MQERETVGEKPDWSLADKAKSFAAYVDWLNRLARASFLNDGDHPEMFFFVGEDGALNGAQFRPGLEREKRNAAIMDGARRFNPFGTVHVRIVNANVIDAGQTVTDETQWCLWLNSENRLGDKRNLASPIERSSEGITLKPTVMLQDAN